MADGEGSSDLSTRLKAVLRTASPRRRTRSGKCAGRGNSGGLILIGLPQVHVQHRDEGSDHNHLKYRHQGIIAGSGPDCKPLGAETVQVSYKTCHSEPESYSSHHAPFGWIPYPPGQTLGAVTHYDAVRGSCLSPGLSSISHREPDEGVSPRSASEAVRSACRNPAGTGRRRLRISRTSSHALS